MLKLTITDNYASNVIDEENTFVSSVSCFLEEQHSSIGHEVKITFENKLNLLEAKKFYFNFKSYLEKGHFNVTDFEYEFYDERFENINKDDLKLTLQDWIDKLRNSNDNDLLELYNHYENKDYKLLDLYNLHGNKDYKLSLYLDRKESKITVYLTTYYSPLGGVEIILEDHHLKTQFWYEYYEEI